MFEFTESTEYMNLFDTWIHTSDNMRTLTTTPYSDSSHLRSSCLCQSGTFLRGPGRRGVWIRGGECPNMSVVWIHISNEYVNSFDIWTHRTNSMRTLTTTPSSDSSSLRSSCLCQSGTLLGMPDFWMLKKWSNWQTRVCRPNMLPHVGRHVGDTTKNGVGRGTDNVEPTCHVQICWQHIGIIIGT